MAFNRGFHGREGRVQNHLFSDTFPNLSSRGLHRRTGRSPATLQRTTSDSSGSPPSGGKLSEGQLFEFAV